MTLGRALLLTTALALAAVPAAHAVTPVDHIHRLSLAAEAERSDAEKMAALGKAYGTWGFDTAGMDTTVKPGDDFFEYANGAAVKALVIPGDQPGYGSFDKLADLSELQLKTLIQSLASASNLTGDDQKIADLYKSAMDTRTRNARDAAPLAPVLRDIASIKTKAEMAAYMGRTSAGIGSAIYGLSVYDDAKKPGYYALQVGQAGLGLPDRDYYLSATYADKLKAYEAYVTDMLRMAGYPDAAGNAHAIVAFETEIAKVSWTRIEQRDDTKTYNPMKLTALPAYAPGFDWAAFFKGAGVTQAKKVVVAENTAFPRIARLYAATPLQTLKAWEAYHSIDEASAYLSDRFYDRRFQFHSKTLYGVEEERPLWKRAVGTTDNALGEALGRAYVAKYFPPDSKAKMVDLVHQLLTAMTARIRNVTWMSDATKQKALEKIARFGVKIGYPNHWRDYSKLVIKPDDLFGNVERSAAFEWAWNVGHIDNKIDPDDWGMTPQTVNAYYTPTRNEIVFPAAILQPPFFDPKADPAVNYGAIGAVIGHEITHGFDDQGRHYDGTGALVDWWTPEDARKFEAQTKALGAQYDAYEVAPGVHVQGGLTMGENIADLGGLLNGLDAYHLSLKGADAPVVDGFSGDQRVFLGFAQVWQSKYQLDYLKAQVATDPHSPEHFRTVGPTRNIDAWYKAFNVQPGETYYLKPEDRVRIW
jgi:putative endopeptidase